MHTIEKSRPVSQKFSESEQLEVKQPQEILIHLPVNQSNVPETTYNSEEKLKTPRKMAGLSNSISKKVHSNRKNKSWRHSESEIVIKIQDESGIREMKHVLSDTNIISKSGEILKTSQITSKPSTRSLNLGRDVSFNNNSEIPELKRESSISKLKSNSGEKLKTPRKIDRSSTHNSNTELSLKKSKRHSESEVEAKVQEEYRKQKYGEPKRKSSDAKKISNSEETPISSRRIVRHSTHNSNSDLSSIRKQRRSESDMVPSPLIKREPFNFGSVKKSDFSFDKLVHEQEILSVSRPRSGPSTEIHRLHVEEKVEILWKRIIILSNIISQVGENQAIVIDPVQEFKIKKLEKTSELVRFQCVEEILSDIKFMSTGPFHQKEESEKCLSLDQMIYYLENANWSKQVLNEVLHKEIQLIKKISLESEELSSNLAHRLFKDEIQVDDIELKDKITLHDLSLTLRRLTMPVDGLKIPNPVDMFSRVLQILKEECLWNFVEIEDIGKYAPKNEKVQALLIQFCLDCLKINPDLDGWHDNAMKGVFNDIRNFATERKKNDLKDAYAHVLKIRNNTNQSAKPSGKAVEEDVKISTNIQTNEITKKPNVDPRQIYLEAKLSEIEMLSTKEHDQIANWLHIIKSGKSNSEMVNSFCRSITRHIASKYTQVPISELASGKLEKFQICPNYHHLCDALDCLSYLVAFHILSCKASNEKGNDSSVIKSSGRDFLRRSARNTEKGIEKSLKERAHLITFYVSVLEELIDKLGDFASAFAIFSGLEKDLIQKLKLTWKHIPEVLKKFESLEDLFSPHSNLKNLKLKMNTCLRDYHMQPPFIYGQYSINYEEIQDRDEHHLINPVKFRGISRHIVIPIQKMQAGLLKAPQLETDPLYDRLFETMELYKADEKTLVKLLQECEPHSVKKDEV